MALLAEPGGAGAAVTDVLGFDVYGTLVDPLGMSAALRPVIGAEHADQVAASWRGKQIEYAFRRAAMGAYEDFSVCTRQALRFTFRQFGTPLGSDAEEHLLDAYLRLPAFPEVARGLAALRGPGRRLLAFSNGTEAAVRAVLGHAGLLSLLDDVVSVDDLRTFKPAPAVYDYLVRRGGQPPARTWLVSSNGWDVIGAKHAGLRSIWLARDPNAVLDPWDVAPDGIVARLDEVAGVIAGR